MKGLTGITFNMQSNIGDITNKKLDLLGNKIGNKYNKLQNLTTNTLQVFTKDDKDYISVSNNIISISINDRELIDKEAVSQMINDLKSFLDAFLLDENVINFSVRFINITDCGFNTMDVMKKFNGILDTSENDFTGLGFRYLFKNSITGYDEIRIEPFLANINSLFLEGNFNLGNINVDMLLDNVFGKFIIFEPYNQIVIDKLSSNRGSENIG